MTTDEEELREKRRRWWLVPRAAIIGFLVCRVDIVIFSACKAGPL